MRVPGWIAALLSLAVLASGARADETADRRGAAWTNRVRFSGSANVGYYGGEAKSVFHRNVEYYENDKDTAFHRDNFKVWDARLFADADLGSDVMLGDRTVLRNVGALLELELVRLGAADATLREAYVDFQGIADKSWLNVQLGRFQVPISENYLRFSQGVRDNPFIRNTLGGPWYWDEGLRLYGSSESGRFGYVASVSDGELSSSSDLNRDKQMTLKLKWDPTDWLHLSASGARSGRLGPGTEGGSIWFGEAWVRPFGSGTDVANLDHGSAVADGPDEIENVTVLGGDAVLNFPDRARAWLAYGAIDVTEGRGLPVYDRSLQYWIAELVLDGNLVSPKLRRFYLGLRGNGFGTYDADRGYLLDSRYASTLGYNMKSITALSLAPGWRMTDNATLRAEYTWQRIELVTNATQAMRDAADHANSFGIETAIHF